MTKGKFVNNPNTPAKECAIKHLPSGRLMKYDEVREELYFSGDGTFTVFISKQRAVSARHHAIETEKTRGAEEEWKEIYQVIET